MINNNSTGRLLDVVLLREADIALLSWAQDEGNVLEKALTAHSGISVAVPLWVEQSASWMNILVIRTNQWLR
jgi:hypothetical protein